MEAEVSWDGNEAEETVSLYTLISGQPGGNSK